MKLLTWHRPLLLLAAAMSAMALVAVIGVLVDDRIVTGQNLWLKPLKFSLSIIIYAVTLSWLIGQLSRLRRLAWAAGTVAAILLAVEMVVIVWAAAAGETSHFNVSTPLHVATWTIMAVSIVLVWAMTLFISFALFRSPLGDRARSLAIRSGAVLALIGMGLAFLMTGPTAEQLNDFRGIAGAHTVGLADGGPGLPLLGWSTVVGDLRVPHFIGMHALQALPLAVIALEFTGTRWRRLADETIRLRLIRIGVAAYAAALVVLTAQALAGQSIVRPDGLFLAVGIAILLAVLASAAVVLVAAPSARSGRRDDVAVRR